HTFQFSCTRQQYFHSASASLAGSERPARPAFQSSPPFSHRPHRPSRRRESERRACVFRGKRRRRTVPYQASATLAQAQSHRSHRRGGLVCLVRFSCPCFPALVLLLSASMPPVVRDSVAEAGFDNINTEKSAKLKLLTNVKDGS